MRSTLEGPRGPWEVRMRGIKCPDATDTARTYFAYYYRQDVNSGAIIAYC